MAAFKNRFRTGDVCTTPGMYQVVAVGDGSCTAAPARDELLEYLESGDSFPSVEVAGDLQDCWWRYADGP
jgi:hypothetical protein